MGNKIGIIAAVTLVGLALCAAAWTALASWLFCWMGGLQMQFPSDWTIWWVYLSWEDRTKWTKIYLAASGVVAFVPFLGVALAAYRLSHPWRKLRAPMLGGLRPIERGVTDNHGHAAWMSKDEISRTLSNPAGTLIGAVDRSEKSNFVCDDLSRGPTHSLIFAGPGSDKSTTLVTRVWQWPGSKVVFDPSIEIGPVMKEGLESRGYQVREIAMNGGGLNVLDWIDIKDPEAENHIHSVVDWIYDQGAANSSDPGKANDPFWSEWGRALVACLLAHMLFDPTNRVPKTLATLREGVATPEDQMQSLLRTVNATSESAMARDLAAGLMGMKADQTFSGIYSNAFSGLRWLSLKAYADVVSGGGMKTSDILRSDSATMIQIPLDTLQTTPALGRAVFGALLNSVYKADGDGVDGRILFAIDEAWLLGRMKEIRLGFRTGRKYGATIQMLWQSEADMEATWGKDEARGLRDSSSWRAYAAVQDGDVAERLSRDIGTHAVMAYSEGSNTGRQMARSAVGGSRSTGENTNIHEIKRRLITADEIMRSAPDDLFVLRRGSPHPLRCVTAPYYRYPGIKARMKANRFYRAA